VVFVSGSMMSDNRADVMAYNHCQFDRWMLLFFCSCSTTPQVFVKMLQQALSKLQPCCSQGVH
jgi:hypothetical protein